MPRARDLGIVIGALPTGPTNSVLDVAGRRARARHGAPRRAGAARGPRRRAHRRDRLVLAEDAFTRPLPAGGAVLNGAGECTGFLTAAEWGSAETPVYLTSTMQLGRVYDAACQIELEANPSCADDVVIPVVGECDDSFLNDARRMQVEHDDVRGGVRRGAGARAGPRRRRTRARSAPAPACPAWASRAASARRRGSLPAGHTVGGAAADQLRRARAAHRRRRAGRPAAAGAGRRGRHRRAGRLLHRGRGHRRAGRRRRRAPGWPAGSGSAWPAPGRWPTTAAARSSWRSAPACGSTATASPTGRR